MEKTHIVCDKILKKLSTDNSDSIYNLHQSLKIDYHYLSYCIDILIKDECLDAISIASKHPNLDDKLITINNKGRFFLNQSGGYTKREEVQFKKNIWTIVKTIAAILNAVIIIIIAFWGVAVQDKSNQLEKDKAILLLQIDSLSSIIKPFKDIDSLNYQNK